MKVLWITNQIIGDLAIKQGLKAVTGQWLNAELEKEKRIGKNKLVVCTIASTKDILVEKNVKYIVLPHGNIVNYQVKEDSVRDWTILLDEENPDILLVWGTENAVGLAALIANNRRSNPIPSAVYIQGVMEAIYKNYRGGFSDSEIKKFTTLIERVRRTSIFDMEAMYCNNSKRERDIIQKADYVIVENKWAENIYKAMNSEIKILYNRLPIQDSFSHFSWSNEKNRSNHKIITCAAGYPLKGIHQVIKALSLVKEKYPDLKLIVPGNNSFFVKGIKARISQHGYNKYVKMLIQKYGLENNVVFVGPLSSDEYARQMSESEVFVCASAIENHCSTLREAMTVGVPSIATNVGGIPEYAINGQNCMLYQFSDYSSLAEIIMKLFSDDALRDELSENAKKMIYRMYNEDKMMDLNEIYEIMKVEKNS